MKRYVWLVATLMIAIAVAGCKAKSTPVSAPGAAPPSATPPAAVTVDLPGDKAALTAALSEHVNLQYQIVMAEVKGGDKDAHLDKLLADKKWPDSSMMVLVVYTDANYDIRFAMGADFFAKKVTVDEVLSLVRTTYLPKARQSDPAGGLADLIRAVDQRMK